MKKIVKNLLFLAVVIIGIQGKSLAQENKMEKSSTNSFFIYYLKLTEKYNNPQEWSDETFQIIQTHSDFIDSLGKKGILIFAGRTLFDPGNQNLFGIAVIKAESLEKAKEIMAPDPAVINGIQAASIFPFSLGIQYFENVND